MGRELIVWTPYWTLEVSIELIGYDFVIKNSWQYCLDVGFMSASSECPDSWATEELYSL